MEQSGELFQNKKRLEPTLETEDSRRLDDGREETIARGTGSGEDFPGAPVALRRWKGTLIFVDDCLTMQMLRMLLADDASRPILLADPELSLLWSSIRTAEIPAGLNPSLAARGLLFMSETLQALPQVEAVSRPRVGHLVRVMGTVVRIERQRGRRLLRIVNSDRTTNAVLTLGREADEGWSWGSIRTRTVLAAGFLKQPRYLHIAGAAAMLLEDE